MNAVNPFQTALYRLLEMERLEAAHHDMAVAGTEILRPIPLQVVVDTFRFYVQAHDLGNDQVLEARVWEDRAWAWATSTNLSTGPRA